MKDEGGGVPVAEFVALKAKMYSIMMGDKNDEKNDQKSERCEKVRCKERNKQ